MAYRFEPKRQYLMPTHFGPMSGPRARPDGSRYPVPDGRMRETFAISYLSEKAALETHLPEGFELFGDPAVTVTFTYMTGIDWLAGRGYNMLGVTVPARVRHKGEWLVGPFLLVLWENLADPIITGREQLGFNKIWCELPEPIRVGGNATCFASWLGHTFARLDVEGLAEAEPSKPAQLPAGHAAASLLHLRYFPKIGALGQAAVCEPVVSPAASAAGKVLDVRRGTGRLTWAPTRWEDMPTQFHVIEGLRALPMLETRSAVYQRIAGGPDHMAQALVEG
ncbi:MAG: acetoacetate decarboxylase family protein [Hyphomicrobiaceae bacterium]